MAARPARRRGGDGLLVSGIHTIGHQGASFSFDNEHPAHQVLLQPVRVARALVTNGEWLEFMAEGGYATPSLWLSDGWARSQRRVIARPAIGGMSTAPGSR